MIDRSEILSTLSKYDLNKISIATLCSHSSLQIFYGAKCEGFKTVGICLSDRVKYYRAFPEAFPDELIVVDSYKNILDASVQEKLIDLNSIIIAHGSFVEYVGSKNILDSFYVPMYGNRLVLEWEGDREKQFTWFRKAGLTFPKIFNSPDEIDTLAFVKVYGARGGRGYFTVTSRDDFYQKFDEKVRAGLIGENDRVVVQEFVAGVRYYPHYFYSQIYSRGLKLKIGGLELLSIDKRIEPIDEVYRGLPHILPDYLDYTVTGNQPVVVRESLLPQILDMGAKLVESSIELFPPGLIGPFCIETVYNPRKGFIVFEVSARIVAGTNLYPEGSPYTPYLFKEPMSTGRRIARDIRVALERNLLPSLVY